MPTELSDSAVFGVPELSDTEVFGARELSDQEAGLTPPPGAIEGTALEFQRGLLAGQQQLLAAQLEAAPKSPSIRQLRRGYVKAMSDPRFGLALAAAGDDPAKIRRVETTLGPEAQVDRVVTAINANRQAISADIAQLETEMQNIPQSEALAEWNKADNSNWFKVLAKNPVEITAGIMAQSIPAMAPAMAANVVAPGGRVGKAIATGAGSFGTEAANAYLDSARQSGYDFTDPVKVQEFFANPEAQATAKAFAAKRGVPIAIFDALTAGLAGKFIEPALRQGVKPVLKATGKEVALQMAGGASGEAAAQVTSGQKLSAKDIVAEALGELASGPQEVISNLRESKVQSPKSKDGGDGGRPQGPSRPMDDELPPTPPIVSESSVQSPTPNVEATETPTTLDLGREPLDKPAPVPEDPRTIAAQMQMLTDGKRSAVLITPGEAMPEVPGNMKAVELEGYGTMIYSPRVHREERIIEMAQQDKLGRILGYGVDRKPKPGTEVGVVTVRDPEGVEKQAVVTDEKNLNAVTKAAEKVAEPEDTVQLEPAAKVIADRQTELTKSTELPEAKTSVPNSDNSVNSVKVTPRHLAEARAALEVDRPPSVHDDIAGEVTTGAVRFPEADFRDMLDTVRDEIAQTDYWKPYKKLRREQRAAVDAQHRMSVSEGLPADQVLNAIAAANPKYESWTVDELAEALSRPPVQTPDSKQVQQLAQEIALAENSLSGDSSTEAVIKGAEATVAGLPPERRELVQNAMGDGTPRQPGFARIQRELDALDAQAGTLTEQEWQDRIYFSSPNGMLRWGHPEDRPVTRQEARALNAMRERVLQNNAMREYPWVWPELQPGQFPSEDQVNELSRGAWQRFRATEQEALRHAVTNPWADKIDNFLTDAIAATNLNRAQTLEGVTGAPVWLTKAALNGLLRVVRATYRGTRSLAQALQAGIEWLRAQNLPDFSETEIKAWLANKVTVTPNDDDINVREFTDQLDADQALPPDPARMVANLLYDRRTNESDAALAARVMQAVGGPAQAVEVFTDATNGLPGSVRMFLGQLIIKAFGVAGQHEAAARFYDETFAAHVTDVAQSLQSLSAWLALTPEGKLIWARRKIERAARDIVAPVQPQLDAAKDQVDLANKEGIEATTASADVQAAAREAVDAGLEKQAQTPGTELAEAIRTEVLNQLVQAGLLTAREAEIFRLHLEGTADNSTLAEKLQRAGIPLHDKRADAINQLYKAKTKTEREKIKSRARKARQQQTAKAAVNGDEHAIDLAIKRAMKELRVSLGQVIREHHTKAAATGQTLAEKIAAASGLNEADAKKLAEAVAKRFAELVTKRKKAALEKFLKPVKRIARPALVDKIVERSNQGALSQEQFWNVVRANLDLPAWSNELADRLRQQIDIIERIPADKVEAKQKAQTELLNTIERAKGIDGLDLGIAFYVTNVLTGVTTHLKNLGSTFLNATGAIGAEGARAVASGHLDDIPLLLESLGEGLERGKLAAGDVLRTGVVTGSRLGKVEPGRALELTQFGQRGGVPVRSAISKGVLENRLAKILNLWKYNFRIMAAEDLLFFKPAEEAKAALLAKRIARSEGLSGQSASDRARTILGYGLKAVETAKAQAEQEGLTGTAAARRTAEILNNNRPLELREDARQFALRTTFNNEPYGVMGAISQLLNQAKASPNTKLRLGANLVTPFTNIIANVVNESLNYTPVGAVRAKWNGKKLLGYERSKLTVQQQADLKAELYAKALVGTTLLTAIALKAAGDLDDPDPDFAIYGAGPASPTDRQGLEAKGWLAHSIKLGDRYYSYANTPLAIPMAWLGGISDRLRDARLFQNRSAQRTAESLPLMAASSAVGMGKVITEQSFMTGLMDLAGTLSAPSAEAGGRGLLKQAVRTGSSVVIPNAVRQVDKFFDPAQYEQRTAEGILVNAIPFVRGAAGQPVLNALGQPVLTPLSRQFTSSQADADPLVKLLAETGNWPTLPDRNHIWPRTGRTMTDGEYYDFVQGSGQIMRRELADLVKDRSWKTLTPEEQGKMIAETVSTAREMWRADHGW